MARSSDRRKWAMIALPRQLPTSRGASMPVAVRNAASMSV